MQPGGHESLLGSSGDSGRGSHGGPEDCLGEAREQCCPGKPRSGPQAPAVTQGLAETRGTARVGEEDPVPDRGAGLGHRLPPPEPMNLPEVVGRSPPSERLMSRTFPELLGH